ANAFLIAFFPMSVPFYCKASGPLFLRRRNPAQLRRTKSGGWRGKGTDAAGRGARVGEVTGTAAGGGSKSLHAAAQLPRRNRSRAENSCDDRCQQCVFNCFA